MEQEVLGFIPGSIKPPLIDDFLRYFLDCQFASSRAIARLILAAVVLFVPLRVTKMESRVSKLELSTLASVLV